MPAKCAARLHRPTAKTALRLSPLSLAAGVSELYSGIVEAQQLGHAITKALQEYQRRMGMTK